MIVLEHENISCGILGLSAEPLSKEATTVPKTDYCTFWAANAEAFRQDSARQVKSNFVEENNSMVCSGQSPQLL